MTVPPRRAALWALALVWLLCAAVLLYIGRYYIATINFLDPDDALRLVEVRDWIAGQSWFDVTQYRSHPPMGAPMHWSRLVDVPLGAFMAFFGLFAAPEMAERLAMVTVPLLMLGGLMAVLYALTVRITGRIAAGVTAAVMLATSVGVLVQFQPMRIDHHGWQIMLTLLAIWFLLARSGDAVRNALFAGLVMAVSLTIAIESLPIAVTLGGVLALRYLRGSDAFPALFAYVLALGGGAALLLPVMLGWSGATVPWCDSMSPAYVLPLLAVALALFVARRVVPQQHLWQRLASLAIAGGVGAALLCLATPQCLRGPFSALDPLVYNMWYLSINEGMPVWKQPADLQLFAPLPSILGLFGTLAAIRFDAAERRGLWIEVLILQGAAFAVSLMVMRAMGLAHVLAIPGNAWLFLAALAAAMRLSTPPGRILAGFACFALMPLGGEVIGLAMLQGTDAPHKAGEKAAAGSWDICVTRRGFEQLNAIPATTLLTPLDIGSHMLAFTHHRVISTGHHRNVEGMKTVISAFIADPDKARGIVTRSGARYIGLCPTENESRRYARLFPRSLAAALAKDRPPAWLRRVPMQRTEDIRLYKVMD